MLARIALLPRFALVVFPFVLGAALLPAQSLERAAAPTAWEQFQQETGSQWLAEWNPATGTPRSIYGEGLALPEWRENSLDEARRQAQLALQRWPGLLGLGTSEFRERIGARMGRTWSLQFDQWFRGLPVIGGRVDVRIHMRGRLCYLGSTAWPIAADFDITPKLGEEQAIAIAWQSQQCEPTGVAQPGTARKPRLVVWGDTGAATVAPPVLAWEVPISAIDASGRGPIGRVYVDAKTGRFLHYGNDKHECSTPGCNAPVTLHGGTRPPSSDPSSDLANALPLPATYTVMAWAHTGLSPVSVPTNVPLVGVEVVVPGVGTVVTDGNGQFTVDLATPTAVTVVCNGIHMALIQGANPLTQQATLQPGVNATIQLGTAGASEQLLAHSTTYLWTHRINAWARSILGNSPELAVADQVQPIVNIASTCNAFYGGNSINFYASGGGCNNTSGASVIAHEWGHGLDDRYGGISQTNGLSEGWGDICSLYLLDDPIIGHDFFSGGGGIRNGNNNRQYPQGGGVHDQGESWMGFAWRFRQNLRTALGPAQAIAISNDVVLGSIVANAGDQANAVLQVFLADDDDGLLINGTPHYAHLVAACQAHSLPYPALQVGYLQHSAMSNTIDQLTPRRVEMAAVPISGSFTQVRVHWNDGQVQQRNMVPMPTGNRWQALLPGQLAPQAVQYHFEAQHSNGTWFRLPLAAEYQYGTLAERRIHLQDFEAGAPGWTHGAITGSDDWEIGAPAGRSGVGWSDPAVAARGLGCAGTDLGIAGDGAYSASSEMWLRSPPIDCTGTTGVRLRCRVWLTCEGPVDQLEVRIGGTPIWLSSQQPLLATSWTVLDLAAPNANNNPNTVVEFRLRSNGLTQYGGWNLDDVEFYTTNQTVALPATLSLLPEQASANTAVTIRVQTAGPQPFLLAIGDAAGPTLLPGIPDLQAGGSLLTLFQFTNGSGQFVNNFQAPQGVPLQGLFWYSHVLTLDGSGAIVASNAFVNLFTQ